MAEPYEATSRRVDTVATAPPPGPAAPPGTTYSPERIVTRRTSMLPVGYRARQLIWLAVAIVNLILALRFVFLATGANDTGFVSAINQAGTALAYPFQGIFATTAIDGGHLLVWACILAIGIYTVAAWIVDRLVVITAARDRGAPAY
jgi:hypothetical protein